MRRFLSASAKMVKSPKSLFIVVTIAGVILHELELVMLGLRGIFSF